MGRPPSWFTWGHFNKPIHVCTGKGTQPPATLSRVPGTRSQPRDCGTQGSGRTGNPALEGGLWLSAHDKTSSFLGAWGILVGPALGVSPAFQAKQLHLPEALACLPHGTPTQGPPEAGEGRVLRRKGGRRLPCHREVWNLPLVQMPPVCHSLLRLLPTPSEWACRVLRNPPKTMWDKRMG